MDQAVFGIIGTGGIAQSQHLPNLARAPHVFLKTACDLREDVLREMQVKYRIPEITTDYHALLADPEIQAVVIATRAAAHPVLAVEALKAGKHVYVEKPLADTEAECAAVVAAREEAGRFAAVGFNRRRAPAYRLAREALRAHGGPINIHYRISDEYWRWGAGYPPGERVIHEVCHVFDILRWFTESEAVSVYCVASAQPDDECFVLEFSSGCIATIMSSGMATMDLPKERFEAIAREKGGVMVEDFAELRTYGFSDYDHITRFAGHTHPDRDFGHRYLLKEGGADALGAFRRMGWELRTRLAKADAGAESDHAEMAAYMENRAPHWNYMVDKGWLEAIDHFAACVLSGETPDLATARDGLIASRIGHAAITSRAERKIVKLD